MLKSALSSLLDTRSTRSSIHTTLRTGNNSTLPRDRTSSSRDPSSALVEAPAGRTAFLLVVDSSLEEALGHSLLVVDIVVGHIGLVEDLGHSV